MIKQYVIDIPFLCQSDGLQYSSIDGAILLDVLDTLTCAANYRMLFCEDVYNILNYNSEVMYKVCEQLVMRDTIKYIHSEHASKITSDPVIISASINDSTNEEICQQLYAMHQSARSSQQTIYYMPRSRNNGGKELTTALDKKECKHKMCIFSSKIDIAKDVESTRPKLDQLKHKDFERVFGEKPVSALTSSNDLAYANELLQQAYDESKDIVDFPKYLFTYDKRNDTYVEFRHSGQGRYHGMDVKNDVNDREYQRMPSYIVDMYRK